MELTNTIKVSAIIGAAYAANCLVLTDKYLEDQGVENNVYSKYITRGLTGGVIGLTTSCFLAGWGDVSDETLKIVGKAHVAAFSFWISNCVYQLTMVKHEKESPIGPKVDLGICTAMLGLFASSLAK